ncbi:MAG TPA: VCBS repeat-containing protein [Polyangiaceae bacterium]|jgi:hypothetical protein|nr:VCBS repeat-containing protein [Polyangiaceae bacterium]
MSKRHLRLEKVCSALALLTACGEAPEGSETEAVETSAEAISAACTFDWNKLDPPPAVTFQQVSRVDGNPDSVTLQLSAQPFELTCGLGAIKVTYQAHRNGVSIDSQVKTVDCPATDLCVFECPGLNYAFNAATEGDYSVSLKYQDPFDNSTLLDCQASLHAPSGDSLDEPIVRESINGGPDWLVGKFDTEYHADVLFWWKADGTNRLFRSNGDGTFSAVLNPIPTASINAGDQWVQGDFNGDGLNDVLFWWKSTGVNRLFTGTGSGFTSAGQNLIAPIGDQVRVGDFNADGRSDLFFWSKSSGSNRVFMSNATPSVSFTTISDPIATASINGGDELLIADITGDGASDLYFWWKFSGTNRLFASKKLTNGFDYYNNPIATAGINGGDLWASADFDATAGAEVLFWWRSSGTNRLYKWSGGAFQTPTSPIATATINGGDSWELGDFNADKRADILFWWKASGQNRLLLSSGTTYVAYSDPIAKPDIDAGERWAIADFVGTGNYADAYFFWPSSGKNRLYRSNGLGALPRQYR